MNKKIKNIVLIEPRSPDYHVFSKFPLPRMGVLILGSLLRDAGYNVKVFVETIRKIDFDILMQADIVGISGITSTVTRCYELAKLLRLENIPVVMGGPHVSFMPDEALKYCDYVLKGEADDNILDFIKAFESGEGLDNIPGLSYKVDGRTVHNKMSPLCNDLDRLPIPDFNLIHGFKGLSVYPVITSRGCPYDCNFCSVTEMFGHKYRFMSSGRVIETIKSINPNWVFFYDDNFTASPARAKELLNRMIRENVTPKWTAQVRTDVARDTELLKLMQKSNCYACYIGIESINPETLKYYNKKQTIEDIELCVKRLHEHNIKIHGMFVLGSDEDSVDVVRETANFAKKYEIDTIQFMILTPLPGTKLYDQLFKEGRILTTAWSLYDGHHVVFKPKAMTTFQLQWETFKAMKSFYSYAQIIKSFLGFKFSTTILRLYAHRLINQWIRKNRIFVNITRNFTLEKGKRLEGAAQSVAIDLWKKLVKFYRKSKARLLVESGKH
ncbi:MAG TPA: radical SAM protein [bacterium]